MGYHIVGIIPVGGTVTDEYPLVQSRCHYNILDVYTIAEVVQDYHSNANYNRDVEYVFPLPPSAAVCSFKAVIDDDKVIKGIVKEKGEAKKEYDEAVSQGKTAGLLQQEHADVFRVSLGNIKPNQKISVHMSFVSIIPHDGSSPQALRITMPTAIAPRYGVAPTNIPWFKKNRGNRFELTVAVQMSKTVTSISSPSHPIGLTLGCAEKELTGDYEPSKVFVRLGNSAFLDKDIVIVISAQGLDAPRCTVERWLASEGAEEATDAYALTLVPKFDLPPLPSQEYIFLVDRSGSMDGGRMEAVKTSLQIMLKSLPSKNTTFNIISFGSDHTSLWHKSQIYSAETVAEASKHVDTFTANYGGTSLRSALRFAFSSRQALAANSTEKPPASVFVLTDGEAWDLNGVNNLVRESVESAKKQDELLRAFVLGVGNQVSTAMCEAIARAGQGCAVFVAEGEKPAAKLMNLLKAARGGMIEDLAIDWGVEESVAELEDDFEMISDPSDTETPAPQAELPPLSLFDEEMPTTDTTEVGPQKIIMQLPPPPVTQQAPKSDKLPVPLYPGFRCSIFAIIKQSSNPGPYSPTIKITGKVLGRAVAFQVPVTPITVNASTTARTMESGKLLHTLAAKALIQVYEDMQTSAETKAQIERLGKRYSLASSVTSFLAIDHELSSAQAVRSQANTISPVVESRRFRSRSPRTTMIPAPMESSRSRSRSPQIIHVNASVKSRRSRSRSPRTITMPLILESRRSRSRSPRRLVMRSRRSRSRSPRTIMMPAPVESRRSRSRSPRRTMVYTPVESRRSRSRSPRTIIIPAPLASRRSRSRSLQRIIMSDRVEYRRSHSRSPRTAMVPTPMRSRHSRSRSPRTIMMPASRRSRSRSPRRTMVYTPVESRRSRSRSPQTIIIPAPVASRRSRSRSLQRIIMPDHVEYSRSRSRSPRTAMMPAPMRSRRSRSRSPRTIMMSASVGNRFSRSRSPCRIITSTPAESRRSRSRSRRIITMPESMKSRCSRSRTPPIIITSDLVESRRYRSRSPQGCIMPTPVEYRRSRSRSPRTIRIHSARLDGGLLTLETIARAQQFDGSFSYDTVFLGKICEDKKAIPPIPALLAGLAGDADVKQVIWATVLVLVCLKRVFGEEKDAWEILAEKATEFVQDALNDIGADEGVVFASLIANV